MSVPFLSHDVLYQICTFLQIPDIIRFSRTSKCVHAASVENDMLWEHLLRRDYPCLVETLAQNVESGVNYQQLLVYLLLNRNTQFHREKYTVVGGAGALEILCARDAAVVRINQQNLSLTFSYNAITTERLFMSFDEVDRDTLDFSSGRVIPSLVPAIRRMQVLTTAGIIYPNLCDQFAPLLQRFTDGDYTLVFYPEFPLRTNEAGRISSLDESVVIYLSPSEICKYPVYQSAEGPRMRLCCATQKHIDEEKVRFYRTVIQDGCRPYAILLSDPTGNSLFVVDGHHKIAAYLELGLDCPLLIIAATANSCARIGNDLRLSDDAPAVVTDEWRDGKDRFIRDLQRWRLLSPEQQVGQPASDDVFDYHWPRNPVLSYGGERSRSEYGDDSENGNDSDDDDEEGGPPRRPRPSFDRSPRRGHHGDRYRHDDDRRRDDCEVGHGRRPREERRSRSRSPSTSPRRDRPARSPSSRDYDAIERRGGRDDRVRRSRSPPRRDNGSRGRPSRRSRSRSPPRGPRPPRGDNRDYERRRSRSRSPRRGGTS